jgi:hypothetical protein
MGTHPRDLSLSPHNNSLTIPLAMLADIVLKGKSFGWLYLLGSTTVVGGFLLVNCDNLYVRFQHRAWAWLQRRLPLERWTALRPSWSFPIARPEHAALPEE